MNSEASNPAAADSSSDGRPREWGKKWFGRGNSRLMQGLFDSYKREYVELLRSEVNASLAQVKDELLAETRKIVQSEIAAAAMPAVGSVVAAPAGEVAPLLPNPSNARGLAFADRLTYGADERPATGERTPSRLEAFFDAHSEGRGIWKWRHYFDIYHRHFAKFVGRKPTILEIGVFSGGSLLMWQDYFGGGCRIYGVDLIEECRQFESDSVRIILGDQGDREFWRRFKAEVPPVDIIIDDGSHHPEHQIVTFEEMLPHLRPGGVYLCEDIYHREFDDFVDGFSSRLSTMGPAMPGVADFHLGMAVNGVQKDIQSIHRYPLVTVVERAQTSVDMFSAPQRGTTWVRW